MAILSGILLHPFTLTLYDWLGCIVCTNCRHLKLINKQHITSFTLLRALLFACFRVCMPCCRYILQWRIFRFCINVYRHCVRFFFHSKYRIRNQLCLWLQEIVRLAQNCLYDPLIQNYLYYRMNDEINLLSQRSRFIKVVVAVGLLMAFGLFKEI